MKRGSNNGPPKATVDELTRLLRAGAYLETAAAACDVTSATLRNWLKYARQGDERFAYAAAEIHKACAYAEHRALAFISAAAETDWKAAAWFLEKRFPLRWGSRATGETWDDGEGLEFDWEPSETVTA